MALIISGGISVFGLAREGAMRQQAKTRLAALATQIEARKVQSGYYATDLSSLQNSPDITDPWGSTVIYQLAADGTHFILTSNGSDLTSNTTDDITYDSSKD